MDRPEWHTPKGQKRRDLLLDAAMEVIAERGYAGATQRAIAARAGVAAASTHYFFSSIEELNRTAASEHLRRRADFYEQFLEEFMEQEPTGAEAPRETVDVLNSVSADMRVAQFEVYLNARRKPELLETVAESMARFEAVGARVLEIVGVRDPARWSKALQALSDGFALQRVAGLEVQPEAFERAVRALVVVGGMDDDEFVKLEARLDARLAQTSPGTTGP